MIPSIDVVRAWKDEAYRLSLTAEQREALPASPVGTVELSDLEAGGVAGGSTEHLMTMGCCSGLTRDAGFCSITCLDPGSDTFTYACK